MKGGDLLGPLTPCHSSTKVTPGGGNEGEGRSGPGEGVWGGPFLCLPHCSPCSLLVSLSSYLALTAPGDLAYPRALLCHCPPPLYSLFAYFCLAGIYSENDDSSFFSSTELLLPSPISTFFPLHIFWQLYPSLPGLFSLPPFPLSQNGSCGRALLRFVCRFRHKPFSGAPLVHALHICRALFVPNLCYRHGYHGYSQQGPLTQ